MSDETTSTYSGNERVGFCQDCGKPLTKETARIVGTGMFCEPCLQVRLSGANAAPNAAGPSPTGSTPGYAGDPHPFLAGFLGFIPGVGAMYNGQFAKGIAHIIVFAVLVSLSKHVNGVFGLLVTGWIFYMAFEAYHTARARRDGLPLPDIFGLNDIGERMGFGKSWGNTAQARPQAPVTPSAAAAQAAPAPASGTSWHGYVPPSEASAGYTAGTGNAPYVAPVPPTPYSTPYSTAQTLYGTVPMPPIPPMPAQGSSFPMVAIWLIGLGVLFTVMQLAPGWRVNGSCVAAIILGAIAASIFVRRLGYLGGMSYQGPLLHMMRGPVILAVLAVMFLLQGVHAATLGQTWPVILLALGAVMLGERMGVGAQPYPATDDKAPASVVPPAGDATTTTQHNDERDGYSR